MATSIKSGERQNIIIFCSSSKWLKNNEIQLNLSKPMPKDYKCPDWCWQDKIPNLVEAHHRLKDKYDKEEEMFKLYQLYNTNSMN